MRLLRTAKKFVRRFFDRALYPLQTKCDLQSARYRRLEAAVPAYVLPDPLTMSDGVRVKDTEVWAKCRRPEILQLFRQHVYGHAPPHPKTTTFSTIALHDKALGGLATRKEVRIGLTGSADGPTATLLVYIPNDHKSSLKKRPIFLGLNFFGNHTVHSDASISVTSSWVPNNSVTEGLSPEQLRGRQSSSWPVDFILRRGYGLATAYCGEVVPDRNDGLNLAIHQWFQKNSEGDLPGYSWGAIGGWAWGLSRAMDYLGQDDDIDPSRVIVMGHSRLGKAALWAAAQDDRFAAAVSNESGCGGAALFRRRFGETISEINASFPHWFCGKFKLYNDREDLLPIDQHELLGLIAPRPAYVASAEGDLSADPRGEFLALKHASQVYEFLKAGRLPVEHMPPANSPVIGTLGYHIRSGRHALTGYDWLQFITFADTCFGEPDGVRSP